MKKISQIHQTQSDIALHLSDIDLINNFKEKYFACLKERAELGKPDGNKDELYKCINRENGWNYIQKIKKEIMDKLTPKEQAEIELAEELRIMTSVGFDYQDMTFEELFKRFIADSKEDQKWREKLIETWQSKGDKMFSDDFYE